MTTRMSARLWDGWFTEDHEPLADHLRDGYPIVLEAVAARDMEAAAPYHARANAAPGKRTREPRGAATSAYLYCPRCGERPRVDRHAQSLCRACTTQLQHRLAKLKGVDWRQVEQDRRREILDILLRDHDAKTCKICIAAGGDATRGSHFPGAQTRRAAPPRPVVPTEKHGTPAGYDYYRCRCAACRAAMSEHRRRAAGSAKPKQPKPKPKLREPVDEWDYPPPTPVLYPPPRTGYFTHWDAMQLPEHSEATCPVCRLRAAEMARR